MAKYTRKVQHPNGREVLVTISGHTETDTGAWVDYHDPKLEYADDGQEISIEDYEAPVENAIFGQPMIFGDWATDLAIYEPETVEP